MKHYKKCINFVETFLHRKKVTLEEIQSLCGLLNFACHVIHPGRACLRKLLELTRGLERPDHRREIKKGLQGRFEDFVEIFEKL